MTGSAQADINAVIKLWNTGQRERAVECVLDQDMRPRLEAEKRRIETPGARNLLHAERPDAVAKRIHETITAILAATE